MILFLEYSAGGKRGGEKFTSRLHRFLSRYYEVYPKYLSERPAQARTPIGQLFYNFRLVKLYKPDIIVVDVSSGIRNILAVKWQKTRHRPVITLIQGVRMKFKFRSIFLVRWLIRLCESYLLGQADLVIACSKHMADFAHSKCTADKKYLVAYPGLEMDDAILNLAERERVLAPIKLLSVGECTKVKGLEYLIKAVDMIDLGDIELNILGGYDKNDPYFRSLNRLVRKHGNQASIFFNGFLEKCDVYKFYLASSIYIQSSLMEGYPISILEAMAHGLPVVATSVGGIPEMIENGINGIMVPPKNPGALAAAIATLITDTELWNRMHRNNLAKARTLPTWDDFDKTLERDLAPEIEYLTGMKPF